MHNGEVAVLPDDDGDRNDDDDVNVDSGHHNGEVGVEVGDRPDDANVVLRLD